MRTAFKKSFTKVYPMTRRFIWNDIKRLGNSMKDAVVKDIKKADIPGYVNNVASETYEMFTVAPNHFNIEDVEIFGQNRIILENWVAVDDRQYGGSSSCEVKIIKNDVPYNHEESVAHAYYHPLHPDNNTNATPQVPRHILHFYGNLLYEEDIRTRTKAHSTFCACKASFRRPLDLRDYQGFSITVESKHRIVFTMNMECTNYISGELYQHDLTMPGGKPYTFHIPFNEFKNTVYGMRSEYDREMDSPRPKSLSFLIKSTEGGDFDLKFTEIKALHNLDEYLVRRIQMKPSQMSNIRKKIKEERDAYETVTQQQQQQQQKKTTDNNST